MKKRKGWSFKYLFALPFQHFCLSAGNPRRCWCKFSLFVVWGCLQRTDPVKPQCMCQSSVAYSTASLLPHALYFFLLGKWGQNLAYVKHRWPIRKSSFRYTWEKNYPIHPCHVTNISRLHIFTWCVQTTNMLILDLILSTLGMRWSFHVLYAKGDLAQILKQSSSEIKRYMTLQKRRHNWIWTNTIDHKEADDTYFWAEYVLTGTWKLRE